MLLPIDYVIKKNIICRMRRNVGCKLTFVPHKCAKGHESWIRCHFWLMGPAILSHVDYAIKSMPVFSRQRDGRFSLSVWASITALVLWCKTEKWNSVITCNHPVTEYCGIGDDYQSESQLAVDESTLPIRETPSFIVRGSFGRYSS